MAESMGAYKRSKHSRTGFTKISTHADIAALPATPLEIVMAKEDGECPRCDSPMTGKECSAYCGFSF